MILKDFIPHATLREFIQCYRIIHFEFDKREAVAVKAYAPKPECILHFILGDYWAVQKQGDKKQVQPPIVLLGQRTSVVQQFTGHSFTSVQIVFQPTTVFRLTGIPAHELTNQHLDARDVFHDHIQFYLEQLQHAKSYSELITILESYSFELIQKSLKSRLALDRISQQMIQKGSHLSLDSLADASCLSPKQFKRRFYERVGVNPKTYSRIIRFNKAFNLKNAYPHWDWLTILVECDYYDYHHLVRDYREFTDLTPPALHKLESQAPERILGLTDQLYQERVIPG